MNDTEAMADQVMVTMPQIGWRMMSKDDVPLKTLFPTPRWWNAMCKEIHRRQGTMVFMVDKTTTMITIFHVITSSTLDYLRGKQNKARQGQWAATSIQGWVEGQGKAS